MRDVAIIGASAAPVQKQGLSLRELALQSSVVALADAELSQVDGVVVGSMASGEFTGQNHLGPLLADQLHLTPAPAMRVEAACASGSAAFHVAHMAVASGMYDTVLVTGVEKMSGVSNEVASRILAGAADYEYEVEQGATFVALNAMLMRRYLHDFGVAPEMLMRFTVNAHRNALTSPHALMQRTVSIDDALASPVVADPIRLYDCSPICDGAASVVLASEEIARNYDDAVWVRGAGIATDTMSFHDRSDLLHLGASSIAAERALGRAGMSVTDVDLYEIHDAFTVTTALILSPWGFIRKGKAGTPRPRATSRSTARCPSAPSVVSRRAVTLLARPGCISSSRPPTSFVVKPAQIRFPTPGGPSSRTWAEPARPSSCTSWRQPHD